MGRVKLQLKRIENRTYRHITFAKRKSGLVKKAYELSTLCDVEVAVIIFSPAGKLILFDGKKRIEEILAHYIDFPVRKRQWLPNIRSIQRIVAQLKLEARAHRHLTRGGNAASETAVIGAQLPEIQEEIRKYSSLLADVEKELNYFVKSPGHVKSVGEAEYQETLLEEALMSVRIRKQVLQANNGIQPTLEAFGNFVLPPFTGFTHQGQIFQPQAGSANAPIHFAQQSKGLHHPLRSQTLCEMPPSSPNRPGNTYHGGNQMSYVPQLNGCLHPLESQNMNANFNNIPTMGINNTQEAALAPGVEQSLRSDSTPHPDAAAMARNGNPSNLDNPAAFPFDYWNREINVQDQGGK